MIKTAQMTGRERLESIFKGLPVDRPSLKLWGLSKGQSMMHEDYRGVYEKAMRLSDRYEGGGSPFDFWVGTSGVKIEKQTLATKSPEWMEEITTVYAPHGPLQKRYLYSTCGKPGYTSRYLVQTPEDLQNILSIDYKPYSVNLEGYFAKRAETGDDGITLFHGAHAGYALQELMGSELLAYWTYDQRELLLGALDTFTNRYLSFVQEAITAGLGQQKGGFFTGWVGPELLIPPLVSFDDFDEFVFQFDKKICDVIKNNNGYIWMHCHGKVGQLLTRFADMGIDVINPLEPPDMGDVTLSGAIDIIGSRMALEGNIEIGDIMTESTQNIREQVERAVREGSRSGRFILCASAGYMEVPSPPKRYIDNLHTYLDYGYELVNQYKY